MIKLNFPNFNFKIKSKENRDYIFDEIRKKYIILSNEEWVRQNCVKYIISEYKYPISHINVEKTLIYNNLKKRSDILIFNNDMTHFLVVECKSYKLKLNKSHISQSAMYNKIYKSKYVMISNGLDHIVCKYDWNNDSFEFMKSIPKYRN